MGKSILRMDRLSSLQEKSKRKWSRQNEDDLVRFIVQKNKIPVLKVAPAPKPEPEHKPVPVVAIEQRPRYMATDPEQHFLLAMKHIGLTFFKYVPKEKPKPKPVYDKPEIEKKNIVTIDPITGKRKYKKKHVNPPPEPDPERKPITRPAACKTTDQLIYEKYGL